MRFVNIHGRNTSHVITTVASVLRVDGQGSADDPLEKGMVIHQRGIDARDGLIQRQRYPHDVFRPPPDTDGGVHRHSF